MEFYGKFYQEDIILQLDETRSIRPFLSYYCVQSKNKNPMIRLEPEIYNKAFWKLIDYLWIGDNE